MAAQPGGHSHIQHILLIRLFFHQQFFDLSRQLFHKPIHHMGDHILAVVDEHLDQMRRHENIQLARFFSGLRGLRLRPVIPKLRKYTAPVCTNASVFHRDLISTDI